MIFDGKCVSLIGENHLKSNPQLPCQDASGYLIDNDYSIVAVADGHSSKIRSSIGSQLAVQIAISSIKRRIFDYYLFCDDLSNDPDKILNSLSEDICDSWRRSIFDYDVLNPLSNEELQKIGVDQSSKDIFRRYGTTLLIGVLAKDFIFVLQLGDGLAHIIFNDGSIKLLNLVDSRCEDTKTTSMSDSNAQDEFHSFYTLDRDSIPVAIALCSDGFDAFLNEHGESVASLSIMDIFSNIPDDSCWFSQSCLNIENRTHHSTKDDVSLALVYDCEANFIDIYCKHFGKRYPSRMEEYAEQSGCSYKIAYGGQLVDGSIQEYAC